VFDTSYANYTTWRRTWGRWEGSHVDGSKMTYAIAYDNYNLLVENAIGTADGIKMKETYRVKNFFGEIIPEIPEQTNYSVYEWNGIFSFDRMIEDKKTNSEIIGSIAYLNGGERMNGINLTDNVAGFAISK